MVKSGRELEEASTVYMFVEAIAFEADSDGFFRNLADFYTTGTDVYSPCLIFLWTALLSPLEFAPYILLSDTCEGVV